MRAWHFTETAYPYLPPADEYELIRVTLPNRHYDPKKGAELYDRFLAEWQIAEAEGVNIMVNEHHQTATCVDPAAPLMLAALARLTKTARLLILGNPISNCRDPIRVAEEMAVIDILSHGRVELGFVRGVPYELAAANANPVRLQRTALGGAGSHRQSLDHPRRTVQPRGPVLPSPQRQHLAAAVPAAASAGLGPRPPAHRARAASARAAMSRRRSSPASTAPARCSRPTARVGARPAAATTCRCHRLAYAPLLYTADLQAKARDGAEKIMWYVRANKVPPHYANPPGYFPTDANVKFLRGAVPPVVAFLKNASIDQAVEAGFLMMGTPDKVYQQVRKFYDHVGGFGHLLIMGQAGFLDHAETVHGIQTFAREVLPRLQVECPDMAVSGFHEDAKSAAG